MKFPSLEDRKMRALRSERERVILVRLRFQEEFRLEFRLLESGTLRSLALPSIPCLRDFRARLCGTFVCLHGKTELLSNERLDRFASRSCERLRITRQFMPRLVECAEGEGETKTAFALEVYEPRYQENFRLVWFLEIFSIIFAF